MNIKYIPIDGIKSFVEISSSMNVRKISLKINKFTCEEIPAFPLWISTKDISIDNPVGTIKYRLKIWRRIQTRILTATHVFYLKNLNDKPIKVKLEIEVSADPIQNDIHDSKFFEIAFSYAKAMLSSTHLPKCGVVDFKLPVSYYELEEYSNTHFDGYEDFRILSEKERV